MLGKAEDNLAVAQAAAIASPGDPQAWVRYGAAHYMMTGNGPGHYLEAHLAFERAMNMTQMMPGAAMGLATSSYTFGQHEMALDLCRIAQEGGAYREAAIAEGGILLKLGQWQEGWLRHEARLDRPGSRTPRFEGKLSDLMNKTVFVRGEQGFGDNIQFSRYLHRLQPHCGSLIVEAAQGMELLMLYLAPEGAEVVAETDEMLGDVQISIMSLPLLLGPVIGWEPIPPVKLDADFGDSWKPTRIGICTASLVDNATSLRKNPPRIMFNDLGIKNTVSLAYTDMAEDNPWDWSNTARFMAQSCKMVISIDTAVAHLAATMGIETWVLQRFDQCWRWDHPNWYPGVRCFKQSSPGDWPSAFRQVREALALRK